MHEVLEQGVEVDKVKDHLSIFQDNMLSTLRRQLTPKGGKGYLRMSALGQPCPRKLWFDVNLDHDDELSEKLSGDTKLKFMYGDLTEELVLLVASIAGHRVEGVQGVCEINGVKGHRDAIIDGELIDVKSASQFGFLKFKDHKLEEDDPFGYMIQIMCYLFSSQDDPLLVNKDRASFLAFDKQSGKMCLDTYDKPSWFDKIPELVEKRKLQVNQKDLPDRGFEPVPDGKSGNMKLPMNCSYCARKFRCHDNIRTFVSSRGPVYLTEVKREPRMLEIDGLTGEKITKEDGS